MRSLGHFLLLLGVFLTCVCSLSTRVELAFVLCDGNLEISALLSSREER